jgi:hypothetical protein
MIWRLGAASAGPFRLPSRPAYARRCKKVPHSIFIRDGHIELGGELPLNTFGGSLGKGRIHDLWYIIEGALLASCRAGSRQVKDANVSFVGASAPIVTERRSSSSASPIEGREQPTPLRCPLPATKGSMSQKQGGPASNRSSTVAPRTTRVA